MTASLNSGAGTLIGTTTATVVNGVASFNDMEDDKAGTLALQFAAPSLPAVISNPSVVSPAPAAQSRSSTGRPAASSRASSLSSVANAYDPYGNVATSYRRPVTVAWRVARAAP